MDEDKFQLTRAVLDAFNKEPGAHARIGKITAERWNMKRIPPPFRTAIDRR